MTLRDIDVLILGAGINGAGLFRDLCEQGVTCVIADKGDFGGGTSAAPSRLIHGGIKYLETGEFRLVAQSTLERNLLLRNAPEPRKDRDHRGQRAHQVGGIAQQQVAFQRGLRDQPQFAGFQVFDAAVDQARRRGGCAAAEIALVGDHAADALFAQVAEQPCTVDPRAQDQNVDVADAGHAMSFESASIRGHKGDRAATRSV